MKVFRFVQKVFFVGLTILSNFTHASSPSCILMKNQECKARLQIVNLNSNNIILYLTLLVSKQINVMATVIILMIYMQKCVFLIL